MSSNNLIRTLIVDDEDAAREVLKAQLQRYCANVDVVGLCESVDKAQQFIEAFSPDLVFLDINMPGKSGFELLLQNPERSFKTIFTTAFDHYAVQAIKFSALDYLMKPINIDDLISAINKIEPVGNHLMHQIDVLEEILRRPSDKIEKIILPDSNGFSVEKIEDIIRVSSDNNYSTFYLKNGQKRVVSKSLKYYDELLSPLNFFRVHQSHLVNLYYVQKYVKGESPYIIMSDGVNVNIARNKKAEFLQVFNDMLLN